MHRWKCFEGDERLQQKQTKETEMISSGLRLLPSVQYWYARPVTLRIPALI
jgi:hypothetical protein